MAKRLDIKFEKLYELTNRLDFFNTMNKPQRIEVLKYLGSELYVYDNQEAIIHEGDDDNALYVILSGHVGVKKGEDEFSAIGALESGDIFGEVSFITGDKRMSSVYAHAETIVLKLSQKKFNILETELQMLIKDKVIFKLIARLDKMNRRVVKLRNM